MARARSGPTYVPPSDLSALGPRSGRYEEDEHCDERLISICLYSISHLSSPRSSSELKTFRDPKSPYTYTSTSAGAVVLNASIFFFLSQAT